MLLLCFFGRLFAVIRKNQQQIITNVAKTGCNEKEEDQTVSCPVEIIKTCCRIGYDTFRNAFLYHFQKIIWASIIPFFSEACISNSRRSISSKGVLSDWSQLLLCSFNALS